LSWPEFLLFPSGRLVLSRSIGPSLRKRDRWNMSQFEMLRNLFLVKEEYCPNAINLFLIKEKDLPNPVIFLTTSCAQHMTDYGYMDTWILRCVQNQKGGLHLFPRPEPGAGNLLYLHNTVTLSTMLYQGQPNFGNQYVFIARIILEQKTFRIPWAWRSTLSDTIHRGICHRKSKTIAWNHHSLLPPLNSKERLTNKVEKE